MHETLVIEDQISALESRLAALQISEYLIGRRWLERARDARDATVRDAALETARDQFVEAQRVVRDDDLASSLLAVNIFIVDANRDRWAEALVSLQQAYADAVRATKARCSWYEALLGGRGVEREGAGGRRRSRHTTAAAVCKGAGLLAEIRRLDQYVNVLSRALMDYGGRTVPRYEIVRFDGSGERLLFEALGSRAARR
jgi:hypothetical protein